MDPLEKTNRMNLLFDSYGDLLNGKQRTAIAAYYQENLSLSEIAEELAVSKQSVSTLLSRSEERLEKFEKLLKVVSQTKEREKLFVKFDREKERATKEELLDWIEDLRELDTKGETRE